MSEQELNKLVALMNSKNVSIAFAESATAGMASYQFSQALEVTNVLKGGVVTYTDEAKTQLLKVKKQSIKKFTAESQEVTSEMVAGLQALYNPKIAVAVTGLANPGGSEKADKPVGTIFVSISYEDQEYKYRTFFGGSREEIILQAVNYIFENLRKILEAA